VPDINKTKNLRPVLKNGFIKFIDRFSTIQKAVILMGMFAGAGLSVGLMIDDVMGVPLNVEANTLAISEQDISHRRIMREADSSANVFRDSILSVQGSILRTLRVMVCMESARLENREVVQCGLQLLPPQ